MDNTTVDADSEENPLPLPEDMLLKVGGFCLNAAGDWNALAWGYKQAADILTERVLATFRGGDLIIYPITLLYRHHIELVLKDIIRKGNHLIDEPVELKFHHSLKDLWRDCQIVLERAGIPVGTPDFPEAAHFGKCIDQFESYDRSGEAFRFPETRGGSPIRLLDSIDVQNLRTVAGRMSFFLEIIRDTIEERTRCLVDCSEM